MATTITLNDVAQCLAKRTLAESPGLSSPPCSKRACHNSIMPPVSGRGDGDLISPPISTQATAASIPAAVPGIAAGAAHPSSSRAAAAGDPQRSQYMHHNLNHRFHQHSQRQQENRSEEEEEESAPSADWDARSWNTGVLPALPAGLTTSEIRAAREEEACGQSIEDSYKRTLDHFPSPAIMFPSPTLEFDFRIAVKLKPESTQVHGRCHKEITAVSSGTWSGSFGNGKIMAGGYDLGQARGFRPIRIVEGAFVMQTSDDPPATLEMRTRGSLSGPCDVLDTLLSCREPKEIDCRKYGFRMFLTVKTADKRYAEIVNCGLWVASGVWRGEELLIDAYRVA